MAIKRGLAVLLRRLAGTLAGVGATVLAAGCMYPLPVFDNPLDPQNVGTAAPPESAPLEFFGSVRVPGSSGYLIAPYDPVMDMPGDEITMEAWLRIDSALWNADNGWILSQQQIDGVRSWGFFIGGSADASVHPSIATVSQGHLELSVGPALAPDTWVHVAVVYDGSLITVYHDAAPVGSVTHSGAIASNSRELTIGGTYWLPGDSFFGLISEVRIWSVARTREQLAAGMQFDVGAEPGLVARYRMRAPTDHGVGAAGSNDITDDGPHRLHADIAGATWVDLAP